MAFLNSSKQKLSSATVEYRVLKDETYQIETAGKYKKKSRCLKSLRRINTCIGWLLAFCLLAITGLITYRIMANSCQDAAVKTSSTASSADQCSIEHDNRFDCWPEMYGATEEKCKSRGCCWKPTTNEGLGAFCYYPRDYQGYNVTDVKETSSGIEATLVRSSSTFFSPDVKTLKLQVDYQTESRLRLKFYDPNNSRYQVPLDVPTGSTQVKNPLYKVTIQKEPFNIIVVRTSTGETVFDTSDTGPLIFSDQFLQISTKLSTKYLYGLGEHRNTFLQNLTTWPRLVFWNRDHVPEVGVSGYGTHPFYLNLESQKDPNTGVANAHGVFLLNSNAGEAELQPYGSEKSGAVTYRMLGGILDFFIVMGPDPLSVVQQYSDIVGRPYFPPFWSLGFHICKYGIQTASDLKDMIKRNRDAQIPYDVQWNDIDYMVQHKDWTYDKERYKGLPDIVKDLHDNQQRYIIMADPGICSQQAPGTYTPFDDGKKMDVFVKDSKGEILIGIVWPGLTAFPDFFHPNAYSFWYKQAKEYHAQIPFDGLWIDMNEPSNFHNGAIGGCTESKLDNPPYLPPTLVGKKLYYRTVCPSAKQAISTHYNLHNMYGWSQANVSRAVLNTLYPNKRSPMITRSSYPGSGKFTGHWSGDNRSTFKEMAYSIPVILNFNMFGIPQIGVDICGFHGITTPELCTRWTQLGAFYPFMRNHADIGTPYQDPGIFQKPYQDYMRSALQLRYKLLAVLYNGFFKAHTEGLPIIRPLFYMYPGTEAIDKQFMWNDQLLVSPVLDEAVSTVDAFIPDDVWYDFYNGSVIRGKGQTMTLDAPIDRINVHVRGGTILPLLPATQRSDIARVSKFHLLVAPDASGKANGELFWDDGASADSISSKKYSQVLFRLNSTNSLVNKISMSGYKPSQGIPLGEITVYGVTEAPTEVTVNGVKANFTYNKDTKVLNSVLSEQKVDLLEPLTVTWIQGNTDDVGNTDDLGNTDDVGNTDDDGNTDDVGNTDDDENTDDVGDTDNVGDTDDVVNTGDLGNTDDVGNTDDIENGNAMEKRNDINRRKDDQNSFHPFTLF